MLDIEYLIFSGGGIRSYVMVGVFEIINNYLDYNKIKGLSGTSIGALISFFYCIGYDYKDIIEFINPNIFFKIIGAYSYLNIINYLKYFNFYIKIDEEKFLNIDIEKTNKFYCSINNSKFKKFINKYCLKKNIPSDINFLELYNITKKELIVVCSNLNQKKSEYFSYKTTPFMKVYKALICSISIPYIYKPVSFDENSFTNKIIPRYFQNKKFCDGGIYDNFPWNSLPRKNKLGFYLSENGFIFDNIIFKKTQNWINIKNCEMIIDLKHKNIVNTLQILNEEEKNKLISIGRKNTINFLNNYFFIFNFNKK